MSIGLSAWSLEFGAFGLGFLESLDQVGTKQPDAQKKKKHASQDSEPPES